MRIRILGNYENSYGYKFTAHDENVSTHIFKEKVPINNI